MATLEWDKVGEKTFQTGIDHGVLYLPDGKVVVWNGLTSVEEQSDRQIQSFFLDGVKYLQSQPAGDYSAKLRAFTYPEEFDSVNGIEEVSPGLLYYDQPPTYFSLSYQTKLGDDVDGVDRGYKIHMLYNLQAVPDAASFDTLSEKLDPIEFSWQLSGTPPVITDHRPTVHISVDSNNTPEDILQNIKDILYGTANTNPRFPSIDEIRTIFQALGALVIVDNGDGTWQAIDMSNTYITMLDNFTFRIDNADATYLDATTYTISTTNPDRG